ncbi:hypothetical protein IAR55_006188 [Kwoniella newhampshirensis]|uniref:Uncharacterized protein n=1 Tax=Kwoniella newhampshirensis TaxID=1651941 RepID=A0AAW0YFG7_9TREE
MPKPGSRSLSTLSAPTFLTLLWIMFSLLEAADRNVTLSLRPARQAPNGAVDRTDGDRVALGKTWVELGCGWVILGCWAAQRDQQAGLILDIYSANLAIKIALLPLSYIILIFCLTLLNLHLTSSIALYGCRNGLRAITTSQFWNGRSGWWLDRIVLEDDYVDAGGEVFGAEEKV